MNECGAELPETFENSASYISSWMKKLKEDNTAILKASSAAQKATDMILLMQSSESTETHRLPISA